MKNLNRTTKFISQRTLYCESLENFMNIPHESDFIEKMNENLQSHGYSVGERELASWKANYKALKELKSACLPADVMIAFEYQLSIGGRIDCILCGKDSKGKNHVIVLELKQWTTVERIYDNILETFTGGTVREVVHPVQQANDYKQHLLNHFDFLIDETYEVSDVAYCFNYEKNNNGQDDLFDNFPFNMTEKLFCRTNKDDFHEFLKKHLCGGSGYEIMEKLETSQALPTRQLLQAAADIVFEGNNTFTLLGDQHAAFNHVKGLLKETLDKDGKSVIVINGGPGTGKTVIALKLLAEACKNGKISYFATRSTALKDQLQKMLKKNPNKEGNHAVDLIRKTSYFRPSNFEENQIDLLIVDEAHLMPEPTNTMNDGSLTVQVKHEGEASVFCPLSQTLSLMYCSKVTVFLIDDKQVIKKSDVGQLKNIIKIAELYQESIKNDIDKFKEKYDRKKYSEKIADCREKIENLENSVDVQEKECELKKLYERLRKNEREEKHIYGLNVIHNKFKGKINIYVRELSTQFRCQGAKKYMTWVDQVLYDKIANTSLNILQKENFDFRIYNDPAKLYEEIKKRNSESLERPSRLVAGWCWPWSDKQVDPETQDLKHEVGIGDFSIPWETKQRPPKGSPFRDTYAPSTTEFASHPGGINQAGCVHTAQGFEFEYVGVIIGPDLQYDSEKKVLKCIPKNNYEGEGSGTTEQCIRNIYRILMTRGRKGCYIYCCDENVASYLKRFISAPEEFVYD